MLRTVLLNFLEILTYWKTYLKGIFMSALVLTNFGQLLDKCFVFCGQVVDFSLCNSSSFSSF